MSERSEMADMVLEDTREKMAKAVAHARSEFASVRTGRASPALIEKLNVDYYGADVPLQQLGGISVPEPRQLLISPYDKGAMAAIEKAIRNSDLGLNPSNDGANIRLVFPPLTAERRKDLVRLVKHMAEEGRVAVRNLRRAGRHDLDALQRDGELSEDELQRAEKELDRVTHGREAEIDEALAHKEQELLED
jgi:ribosome recycling factor